MGGGWVVDPELQSIVEALPHFDLSDISGARQRFNALRAKAPAFEPADNLELTKLAIPAPAGSTDIAIRICAPVPREYSRPLPALLWIHGGGFVMGDLDGDQAVAAGIAMQVGALVVTVDYRLAPEHPYPAAFDDCYTCLVWLAEQAHSLRIDPERVAVGGISAGAGLAAAISLAARDRGGPAICLQLLDVPVLDDRLETPSMREYTDTPLWTRADAAHSWAAYLGSSPPDPVPAYAAPARSTDRRGLPPAYIVTCECDPLRDEGISFAQGLMQAGVATELHHYPGTFHGASSAGVGTAIARRMVEDRVEALRRAFRDPREGAEVSSSSTEERE
jgi:acetyl esterase